MREIRLTLPLPPRLTNSGKGRSRHWRSLEREKKTYWNKLNTLLLLNMMPAGATSGFTIPDPPKTPFGYAEASAVLYLWNPMDDGNALARLKWVEDWLVKRGYLVGDSRKHLRWVGLPDQVIDRKAPRIELTLTPIEQADQSAVA